MTAIPTFMFHGFSVLHNSKFPAVARIGPCTGNSSLQHIFSFPHNGSGIALRIVPYTPMQKFRNSPNNFREICGKQPPIPQRTGMGMTKRLIYIVAINDPSKQIKNLDYAKYSIASWEYYCNKYGIDLVVCAESDPRFTYPIWNKEKIYEIGKDYDQIGIVDSDTIVRWDAENIFEQISPDAVWGVNDLCDLNWLRESIYNRQHFFPSTQLNYFKYLNAGVLFFSKQHLHIFEKLLNLYLENQIEIDAIKSGGKEQTLLNFVIQATDTEVGLLSPEWNLLSMHKKNMFINNWQLYPNQLDIENPKTWPHFMKYGKIWHFTGFPIEDRVKVMKDVWNLIQNNYTQLTNSK